MRATTEQQQRYIINRIYKEGVFDSGEYWQIASSHDTTRLLEMGFEWFNFVGTKIVPWREDVPHKARALRTYSGTAAVWADMYTGGYNTKNCWQGLCAKKEKALLSTKANYSTTFDNYHPIAPDGKEYLNHQVEVAQFMLNRKRMLLADEPGLGKTISAFAALNSVNDVEQLKAKVLIVCPVKVQKSWKEHALEWGMGYSPDEISIVSPGKGINHEAKILITSYESLDSNVIELNAWGAYMIVLDEAHLVKNAEAIRTQNAAWLIKDATYKLLMTGTPILNRHSELYTLLELLEPGASPHYHAYPHYSKLLKKWLDNHFMLMRDSSVLKDKTPENKNIIHKVKATLSHEYGSFRKPLSVERHEVGIAKIDHAVKLAKDLLAKEQKLTIYCYHNDVADRIGERLNKANILSVVSHGKNTPKQANKAEDDFRKGDTRVFVGTIKASGVGITLIEAKKMIVVELDWTPANLTQTEKRINRIGQTEETEVHYIIAEGIDVEEKMVATLDVKTMLIEKTVGKKSKK